MIQAKITEIGTEAINKEEPMLILFDKTATAAFKIFGDSRSIKRRTFFFESRRNNCF